MLCLPPAPLRFALAALGALLIPLAAAPAFARQGEAVLPNDFRIATVFQNVGQPVALEFAPDGHLFIGDRRGIVSYSEPDLLERESIIDLREEVNNSGDRGMLGLALHPNFSADGGPTSWIYLMYTVSPQPGFDTQWNEDDQFPWTRIVRYQISAAAEHGLEALQDSRQVLLGQRLPDGRVPDGIASVHLSHGIGTLAFGSDGTLLVTSGDGAHFDVLDPGGLDAPAFDNWTHPTTGLLGPTPLDQDCGAFRSQSLASLSGKLLRLDPETGLGLPSNPFFDGDPASNASKVFALGLRNPYRMSVEPGTGAVDPALADPGRVWIGDVGNVIYEEVDVVDAPGLNFGWPCFEGPYPMDDYQNLALPPGNPQGCLSCADVLPGTLTGPTLAWRRGLPGEAVPPGIHFDAEGNPIEGFTGNCSIGGEFYLGGDYPTEFDGSYFFADFGEDYVRRATFDELGNVSAVYAFGEGLDALVDIARDPQSGDLFTAQLSNGVNSAEISRISWKLGTPEAELVVSPQAGLAPLEVLLDASASFDPTGQLLEYTFDFDDGSAPLVTASDTATHTYLIDGSYAPSVAVRDPGGLVDMATSLVIVGSEAPSVQLLEPLPHTEPPVPSEVALVGLGLDPSGPELPLDWIIDLHHNNHVHPASISASGAQTSVVLDGHGDTHDLYYFRVELLGTAENGLIARSHVFVFPEGQTAELAGGLLPTARVIEDAETLVGGANPDLEVVRDAVVPQPAAPAEQWFSTATAAGPPAEEWIGYRYRTAPPAYAHFIELTWSLGPVDDSGGALVEPRVESRINGVWTPVKNVFVDPPWPTAPALPDSFSSYRFRFDPAEGDAIRLIGAPTGTLGFVGVGELRVRAVTSDAFVDSLDRTDRGVPIAGVLEAGFDPATGAANPDPATLLNGTFGAFGSPSLWASFDSSAGAPWAGEDWFGIEFESPQTIDRGRLQIGAAHGGGGRFDDLRIEYRRRQGDAWQPIPGLVLNPPFGGPTAVDYAEHGLIHSTVAAGALRWIGTPSAPGAFGSIGELRAGGPLLPPDCGVEPYGIGAGDLGLDLLCETSPLPGLPMALRVRGGLPDSNGALLYARAPGSLVLLDGHVLLVDAFTLKLLPLSFDAAGEAWFEFETPASAAAFADGLFLQAAGPDPTASDGLDFSAGLHIRLCEESP